MSFESLGINRWICESIAALKLQTPTTVQLECIPPIIAGQDVVACAETGSGKTAAFSLPMLQLLSQQVYGVFSVVLAPTRELCVQISQQLEAFGASLNVRVALLIGGVNATPQALQLRSLPHFVVGSPGRVAEHIRKGSLKVSKVQFLVLDEADRLLTTEGFAEHVQYIGEQCSPKRQTLFFSATISPQLSAINPIRSPRSRERPLFTYAQAKRSTTVAQLDGEYMLVPDDVKICYLVYLVRSFADSSIIIFARTVEQCALLNQTLLLLDVKCVALHSLMRQRERAAALEEFRASRARVLVATDVASRGLDIPLTEMVINYTVPRSSETYIHRVGRTARQGRAGVSITLVSQYELRLLLAVEEAIGKKMVEHQHEEKEVLEFLNEATSAHRLAMVWMKEQGMEEKGRQRKKRRREAKAQKEEKKEKTEK